MHTQHVAATLWFVFGVLPTSRRAAIAWVACLVLLFLQPGVYATSDDITRPEPDVATDGTGAARLLFPLTWVDASELHLLFDPPTLLAVLFARTAAPGRAVDAFGVGAWLAVHAYEVLTVVYGVVMRRVAAPSVVLTWVLAFVLARWAGDDMDCAEEDANRLRWCAFHLQGAPGAHLATPEAPCVVAPRFEIGGDRDLKNVELDTNEEG